MGELKPCPLCGGEADCLPDHESGLVHTAYCVNGDCGISLTAITREGAIEAWNSRPTPTAPPATKAQEVLEAIQVYRTGPDTNPQFWLCVIDNPAYGHWSLKIEPVARDLYERWETKRRQALALLANPVEDRDGNDG